MTRQIYYSDGFLLMVTDKNVDSDQMNAKHNHHYIVGWRTMTLPALRCQVLCVPLLNVLLFHAEWTVSFTAR